MSNELIDYDGDSVQGEPKAWTPSAFRRYFFDMYHRIHHAGGAVPWTLKETTLLCRMREEYLAEDLADMVVYWHTSTHKPSVACRFVDFYSNRIEIYHKMKKATSDYSWE